MLNLKLFFIVIVLTFTLFSNPLYAIEGVSEEFEFDVNAYDDTLAQREPKTFAIQFAQRKLEELQFSTLDSEWSSNARVGNAYPNLHRWYRKTELL